MTKELALLAEVLQVPVERRDDVFEGLQAARPGSLGELQFMHPFAELLLARLDLFARFLSFRFSVSAEMTARTRTAGGSASAASGFAATADGPTSSISS